MPHPLRMFASHDTWFITCRTFQARLLMTPSSPRVRSVCGGVLAKAVQLCGVRLHGYVFLSNHLHLIIQAQGQQVATFMKYLLSNLSRKLAPLCQPRWWGRFWERRYTASPILDESALEERLAYVVAHGVKEGLVRRACEWEGLHCVEQLMDEQPRRFAWLNWTRRWRGKRKVGAPPRLERFDKALEEEVELMLTPLPHWAAETPDRRQQRMRAFVARVEEDAGRAWVGEREPLGPDAIRRQTTEPRPRRKRSPRPPCHASSHEGRSSFKQAYRAFCGAFRVAAKQWLRGDVLAQFPCGAFKPHVYEVRIV